MRFLLLSVAVREIVTDWIALLFFASHLFKLQVADAMKAQGDWW